MDFLNRNFHVADMWDPASTSTSGESCLNIDSAGPQGTLGEVYGEGPSANDQILYYIDNTGAVKADSKGNPPSFTAAADDTAIKRWGGTGSQSWILIYASEAIQAGHTVTRMTASLPTGFTVGQAVGEISTAGTPGKVMGVAQHNIAADTYALILRKGVGYIQGNTDIGIGDEIIPDVTTAGLANDVAAAGDSFFGVALVAGAGAYTSGDMDTKLTKAYINAQG
jgi:hypothetical protein